VLKVWEYEAVQGFGAKLGSLIKPIKTCLSGGVQLHFLIPNMSVCTPISSILVDCFLKKCASAFVDSGKLNPT
jgi:hypothetical protein